MNYTIHNGTGDLSLGQNYWAQYQGAKFGPIADWIKTIPPYAVGVLLDDETGIWDQSRGDIGPVLKREIEYAKAIRAARPELKICNFARCRESFSGQIHALARHDAANTVSRAFISANFASFAGEAVTVTANSMALRSLDRDCDFIPARLYVPETLADDGLSFLYAARAVLQDAAIAAYLAGKPIMAIVMPKKNGPKELPIVERHHVAINQVCDEFGVRHRMLWWNPERSNDPISRDYMIRLVKDAR